MHNMTFSVRIRGELQKVLMTDTFHVGGVRFGCYDIGNSKYRCAELSTGTIVTEGSFWHCKNDCQKNIAKVKHFLTTETGRKRKRELEFFDFTDTEREWKELKARYRG